MQQIGRIFIRKGQRALQRHGFLGLLGVIAERLSFLVTAMRPAVRAERRRRREEELAFDRQLGVETAGWIHQAELDVKSPNQVHATSYAGSNPSLFREAMHALSIDYRRFVFVDFGSGKGRAILLAMEFPFKRIVGIEFSETLYSIALGNVKRRRRDGVECEDVELFCGDVVDYDLPVDDLVCYFCNPFDSTLMTRVLAMIRRSFLDTPRDIYLAYHNPDEAHLIDRMGCFRPLCTGLSVPIWKAEPEGSGNGRTPFLTSFRGSA